MVHFLGVRLFRAGVVWFLFCLLVGLGVFLSMEGMLKTGRIPTPFRYAIF